MGNRVSILIGSDSVGFADITKNGLYYVFRCQCDVPAGKIYRIWLSDDFHQEKLGVPIPVGTQYTLTRRIPVSHLCGNDFQLRLIQDQQELPVFYSMQSDSFPLNELENLRFCIRNGVPGAVIQPKAISNPTGQ